VVEAIRRQAGLLLHGQVNIILHQPLLELVGEREILPELDGFFFSNSGAEAIEGGQARRHATGRPNVIVFHGSFTGARQARWR
jgi:4-aminobutyrate aminotransferase